MKDFKEFLKHITNILEKANVENADVDAKLICCHVLNLNLNDLYFIKTINKKDVKKIIKLINIRKTRKPLQQIIKNVEFLNTTLKINKNVLIPRFDTELLCDIIINDINKKSDNIEVLDLCCGTGAIGISISANTNSRVTISDISNKALNIAKQNVKLNNVNVKVIKSDLFNNINESFNLIVSNPPYIKTCDINCLQPEVKNYEPILALDGGDNGLDFYKKIIKLAPNYLKQNGEIYFEIGDKQAGSIKELLSKDFNEIKIIKDYNKLDRFIYAKLKD